MLSFVKALFSRISLAQQVEDLTRDVRALEYELEMVHLEYQHVVEILQAKISVDRNDMTVQFAVGDCLPDLDDDDWEILDPTSWTS